MEQVRLRHRLGDTGPEVAEIRVRLAQIGLLGGTDSGLPLDTFDAEVDDAVRRFQNERGLAVDGVVGPETYRVLDEARWRLGDRLLSYVVAKPLTGDDVGELQRRLGELGFDPGPVDGSFGQRTGDAVREFQRNAGLPADGTCGPITFKALHAPVTARRAEQRGPEAARRGSAKLPDRSVVIDPGHGGPDRGATGNGIDEAAIVEDVAARVEGRLAATGVRVYLTRGPGLDREPDDAARAAFANDSGANLLLSLHVDRHDNPEASGVTAYYYGSDEPGTTSEIGETFAGLIQREITARTDLVDCRTHPKTWDLLRFTRMAAVRLELGYITNPGDAARLADPQFRDTLAESIAVAIQRVYVPSHEDATTGSLHLPDLSR